MIYRKCTHLSTTYKVAHEEILYPSFVYRSWLLLQRRAVRIIVNEGLIVEYPLKMQRKNLIIRISSCGFRRQPFIWCTNMHYNFWSITFKLQFLWTFTQSFFGKCRYWNTDWIIGMATFLLPFMAAISDLALIYYQWSIFMYSTHSSSKAVSHIGKIIFAPI
jgi:hypothetical protein